MLSQRNTGKFSNARMKTAKVIEQALGGVLFIDEAYALNGKAENDFGPLSVITGAS